MGTNNQKKILLIEDNAFMMDIATMLLEELGYQNIITAYTGKDAIQLIDQDHNIDIIICDWNLPDIDGFEILTKIRSSDRYQSIPFVMATAYGDKAHMQDALAAGTQYFLTKPFGLEELEAIFNDIDQKAITKTQTYALPISHASKKVQLSIAHIQVTDHIALGVLKHMILNNTYNPKYFDLTCHCMMNWNLVQQSLENGTVDAAFILAPIAIDLFSFNVPIQIVLYAHKNGSICVQNVCYKTNLPQLKDVFKGKLFYIPHIMSIHHILANMFLTNIGLKPGLVGQKDVDIFLEVVPPIHMPYQMSQNENVAGFIVAEPLGTKSIAHNEGNQVFLSGDIWENHPCCVVAFREEFIQKNPDAVQEFTNLLIQAGLYISDHPKEAAQIGASFLDPDNQIHLTPDIVESVLTTPKGILTNDLYPGIEELNMIQKYMIDNIGIGKMVHLDRLIEARFADNAYKTYPVNRKPSIVHDMKTITNKSLNV